MCLVVFSFQPDSDRPFVLAGNRDEFFERPTRKAQFWDEVAGLIAGKDLKAGGTWLGVDQQGNMAFLTNFRDPKYFNERPKSRGDLVTKFLKLGGEIEEFKKFLSAGADDYNGYNIVFGNPTKSLHYYSNHNKQHSVIQPGIHGLSNAFLNTEWPKVNETKSQLSDALDINVDSETYFKFLRNDQTFPDSELPDTGVGLELERQLSPPFIRMEKYGTRCSTFIVYENGAVRFQERTYQEIPSEFEDSLFNFLL